MKRNIITIDKDKCIGCQLCVNACQEGAIGMKDGKAVLLRDDYCDGLGNCLPVCPTNAITFEEREALAFDKKAVEANMSEKENVSKQPQNLPCGCPGSNSKTLTRKTTTQTPVTNSPAESQLMQWPVQIKLVPVNAPYFDGANLLIAADCAAFAYADFHNKFIRNRITLIGCPKLDEGDYSEKLTEILKHNEINSVTVVRMEVPCCGGLSNAVKTALQNCGKLIQWQIVTISTDGQIIEN
ncbi:MAG TPA: 4Fe-4S binding protein [Clostridiales bacterium]|nr:4Fe-4S binding protein [Clostridiales bacterium]